MATTIGEDVAVRQDADAFSNAAPAGSDVRRGHGPRGADAAASEITTGVPVDRALREAVAARLRTDRALQAEGAHRGVLRAAVARALAAEGVVASPQVWAMLVRDLLDDLVGLGPVELLLRDASVTDVMINGANDIRVERNGDVAETAVRFDDDEHLQRVVRGALSRRGVRLDRAHPFADAVLDDGARLHAILPPLASRPLVTVRRVPAVVPDWHELAALDTVPSDAAELLIDAVRERRNILVCGRAGAGKTTLLSRLLAEIGRDRAVIIEDTPELHAPGVHAVSLQTRAATPEGVGGVDMATLLRNSLRMRPDRLIVGEVRGAEVTELLQAMNTGHSGSMGTVHANGADEALVRLEGMALLAGIPWQAARAQVLTAIDTIVVLIRNRQGRRQLDCIVDVAAVDALTGQTSVRWSRT